jgi:hypothetical protein
MRSCFDCWALLRVSVRNRRWNCMQASCRQMCFPVITHLLSGGSSLIQYIWKFKFSVKFLTMWSQKCVLPRLSDHAVNDYMSVMRIKLVPRQRMQGTDHLDRQQLQPRGRSLSWQYACKEPDIHQNMKLKKVDRIRIQDRVFWRLQSACRVARMNRLAPWPTVSVFLSLKPAMCAEVLSLG